MSRHVIPAVVGTPMTLETVLLTNSAEFKEKVIKDLMGAASGCKVRIQAYHFDCPNLVHALAAKYGPLML